MTTCICKVRAKFDIERMLSLAVSFQDILLVDEEDDERNSTRNELLLSTHDSLALWTHQQLIVCFISVTLGTLLFFVTFIVPAMIIIRRTRRDKHRMDLRELRRMSDFM